VRNHRFIGVVRGSSSSAPEAQRGYRVERPRVSDAVGLALRDAYAREPGVPEEMAALLRRLSGYQYQIRH
jgi:hypothetical protein